MAKIDRDEKNPPSLLAIILAMMMCWCDTEYIAKYG
jgi:hypothetical protein